MTKRVFTFRVLLYEAVAFVLVAGLVWTDELADLPHMVLGAEARLGNYREAFLESGAILALGAATLLWTRRALVQIRHLEGFLSMCSFCKRIRVQDRWVPIDAYITENSAAVFSHGLCPECVRQHYPEVAGVASP
jgi:hypothetical protein